MNLQNEVREVIGVGVTSLRLGIAEHMARRVSDEESIAFDMAAFVTADVLDGAILREHDMDTPIRRVADGIVDHISIARVMTEVAKNNTTAQPYIGILATRAVIVGGLNLFHLVKTGEVTKGQNKQKATNLATAVFGVVAASGNKPLTHITGSIAAAISLATAPVHLQDVGMRHSGQYREL